MACHLSYLRRPQALHRIIHSKIVSIVIISFPRISHNQWWLSITIVYFFLLNYTTLWLQSSDSMQHGHSCADLWLTCFQNYSIFPPVHPASILAYIHLLFDWVLLDECGNCRAELWFQEYRLKNHCHWLVVEGIGVQSSLAVHDYPTLQSSVLKSGPVWLFSYF